MEFALSERRNLFDLIGKVLSFYESVAEETKEKIEQNKLLKEKLEKNSELFQQLKALQNDFSNLKEVFGNHLTETSESFKHFENVYSQHVTKLWKSNNDTHSLLKYAEKNHKVEILEKEKQEKDLRDKIQTCKNENDNLLQKASAVSQQKLIWQFSISSIRNEHSALRKAFELQQTEFNNNFSLTLQMMKNLQLVTKNETLQMKDLKEECAKAKSDDEIHQIQIVEKNQLMDQLKNENNQLKHQLNESQQRVAELDHHVGDIQNLLNSSSWQKEPEPMITEQEEFTIPPSSPGKKVHNQQPPVIDREEEQPFNDHNILLLELESSARKSSSKQKKVSVKKRSFNHFY